MTAHIDLVIVMMGGQEVAKENINRCWLRQCDDDVRGKVRTGTQWAQGVVRLWEGFGE